MTGLVTEAELALRFDVTERHIADWRRQYGWPCVKVGRVVRYTEEQVRLILSRHTVETTRPAAATIPGQTARSARAS